MWGCLCASEDTVVRDLDLETGPNVRHKTRGLSKNYPAVVLTRVPGFAGPLPVDCPGGQQQKKLQAGMYKWTQTNGISPVRFALKPSNADQKWSLAPEPLGHRRCYDKSIGPLLLICGEKTVRLKGSCSRGLEPRCISAGSSERVGCKNLFYGIKL